MVDAEAEGGEDPAQAQALAMRFASLVEKAGKAPRVAALLGVSPNTVNKWTRGLAKIPFLAVQRVSQEAGLSLDGFAAGEFVPTSRASPVSGEAPVPGRGVHAGLEPVKLTDEQLADLRRAGVISGLGRVQLRPDPVPGEPRERMTEGAIVSSSSEPSDFIPVPVMGVSASAGPGRFPVPYDLSEGDMVAFRQPWLRMMGFTPGRVHILWAVGDSMVPTISNGDMLLIDRATDRVVDDGIYVVVVGGGVVVKRVQLRHNGSVVLKSDNRLYDEQTIPADEVPQLVVEGRVRWAGGPI